jgi:hypothetical protein
MTRLIFDVAIALAMTEVFAAASHVPYFTHFRNNISADPNVSIFYTVADLDRRFGAIDQRGCDAACKRTILDVATKPDAKGHVTMRLMSVARVSAWPPLFRIRQGQVRESVRCSPVARPRQSLNKRTWALCLNLVHEP